MSDTLEKPLSKAKTSRTHPPGLAVLGRFQNNIPTPYSTSVHLLVLTRPYLAGFDAPTDTRRRWTNNSGVWMKAA